MFDNEGRPEHSFFGASSAYRFTECLGSVNLIKKLGWRANYTSEAAAQGTVAHEFSAELLKSGDDAWVRAGEKKKHKEFEFELDSEMSEGIQLYLDFCRDKFEKYKDKNAEMLIEHALESVLDPEAYGAADNVIYVPGDRIIITDFKYGYIIVEPTAFQLKYYGYLAYENRPDYMRGDGEPKVIELWICQPRMPHPKGLIRKHITNGKELTDWFTETILPAIDAARDELAPLKVGEHCIFCPGKKTGTCPALQNEVFEFNIDLEPNYLSDQEIGEVLVKKKAMTKFMEDLETIALQRARQGSKIPGRKLVRQTGNRVFKKEVEFVDEDTGKKYKKKLNEALIESFGDKAYTPKEFRSPAQIAKLPGGSNFVATWCFQPDKGTTLVSLSDKRDEIVISGDALFGDIEVPETE